MKQLETGDSHVINPEARAKSGIFARLPMKNRLTLHLSLVMTVSSILLLATITFLAFLWFSKSSTWHRIVLVNWVTRPVTLSAIILRACVSLQASIVTSMLAALIIEYPSGVRLLDIPEVSLTTLGAQLSSTLLLSDVALSPVVDRPVHSLRAYAFNSIDELESYGFYLYEGVPLLGYWDQLATEYPTFGEYSIPSQPREGVDDTGIVIRSVIPISTKAARESLVSYTGPAHVFDARTVCVQPKIIQLNASYKSLHRIKFIEVTAAPLHELENAILNTTGATFNCDIAINTRSCPDGLFCESSLDNVQDRTQARDWWIDTYTRFYEQCDTRE